MMKVGPACLLPLFILCATVLLVRGQGDPEVPGALTGGHWPQNVIWPLSPSWPIHTVWPSSPSWSMNPIWPPRPPRRFCRRRGEVYLRCRSSTCGERKCSDVFKKWLPMCTSDCVNGCFCREGLYRDHRRRCVLRRNCIRH
uniref:TIL domain-containing protein n=1 Tax=Amblyomma maculatum TaxID=34609 RepID=G3MKY9_AMBMU